MRTTLVLKSGAGTLMLVAICLAGGLYNLRYAANSQVSTTAQKEKNMTRAKGTFDVTLTPLAKDDKAPSINRMSIDKQFHGDLQGTSKGEMLSVVTAIDGSAGYVALERVSGTINDRTGTFDLQHSGIMNRGVPQLSITVVPDSGTGQFEGISGQMNIIITDGKHSYDFEYMFGTR